MSSSKGKYLILTILAFAAFVFVFAWLNKDYLQLWMLKRHFTGLEIEALKEDFRGIETSDGRVKDLFPIKTTGVSTLPIQIAAEQFITSLNDDQKQRTLYPVNDIEWRKWSNVDFGVYDRQGLSLQEMSSEQKERAFELLQVSLSAKGLQLSKDIMKTDQTLKEFQDGAYYLDEELYFFTIMGEPSQTEPWGWQLDGHHLVINYFILGDQVVMTPTFLGAEPAITTTGKYKGNTLFQDEQNLGLAFMQSLTEEQQKTATIQSIKTGSNNLGEANNDNLTLDYAGLQMNVVDSLGKERLLNLVEQYINNMRDGHSQIKMEEVRAHIDNTWWAWVGAAEEDAIFYYRIHSPVVLIEFDHQKLVAAPGDQSLPSRNHVHSLIRTPNGNDYGKDLLRQHLEKHH